MLTSDDGWTLDRTRVSDIDRLMKWFPDGSAINVWGGPEFRYPFTRHSFAEDMHWGRIASFSLRDPHGELAAFGQLYERFDAINLARLVAHPDLRGQGIGKRLVGMLMTVGRTMFPCTNFSLFVYRDNAPAFECYRSMGFMTTDYPEGMNMADVCYYLTRPVGEQESSNAP